MSRLKIIAVVAFLVAVAGPLGASTLEAEVKAAYLLKLGSFVRWPAPPQAGPYFRICIVGRSDVAEALARLAHGQQVEGRAIAVTRMDLGQVSNANGCQILYLGKGAQSAQAYLADTAGAPVLTVTDRHGGTRGGVIEFMQRDGKVRFAIDRGAAAARHMELNSKLLSAAAEVTP